MNRKGVSTVELLMWAMGGVIGLLGYIHLNFATYREVVPRLERYESQLDRIESLIVNMKGKR